MTMPVVVAAVAAAGVDAHPSNDKSGMPSYMTGIWDPWVTTMMMKKKKKKKGIMRIEKTHRENELHQSISPSVHSLWSRQVQGLNTSQKSQTSDTHTATSFTFWLFRIRKCCCREFSMMGTRIFWWTMTSGSCCCCCCIVVALCCCCCCCSLGRLLFCVACPGAAAPVIEV